MIITMIIILMTDDDNIAGRLALVQSSPLCLRWWGQGVIRRNHCEISTAIIFLLTIMIEYDIVHLI